MATAGDAGTAAAAAAAIDPVPACEHPPAAIDVRVKGTIAGAPFCIIEPEVAWNGRVLIYAHGYRPVKDGARLPDNVEIDADGGCYTRLRSEGWVVAATMYRRDGVIIKDAMDDVINLRAFIVARYTRHYGRAVECVLLEGQSMGGAISTRLAERVPSLFQGVLGVGAALLTREDVMSEEDKTTPLLQAPVIPILYLTNESEIGPIDKYIAAVREKIAARMTPVYAGPHGEDEIILPALWSVARPGHNWTNQDERYAAVQGLLTWLAHETFITCRRTCGTRPPVFKASTVTFHDPTPPVEGGGVPDGSAAAGGGATGTITDCSDSSFRLDFNELDLEKLGIVRIGTAFEMTVLGGTHTVVLDEYPFIKCTKGALMAMLEADHREVLVTVHNVVGHDDLRARVGRFMVGDAVTIRPQRRRVGRLVVPEGLR